MEKDGAKVRVMAGVSLATTGPIAMRNPGLLLDVQLSPGASFRQEVRAPCKIRAVGFRLQGRRPMAGGA